MKRIFSILPVALLASTMVFFAACGDDSSNSPQKTEVIDEVETFDDLVKCTEKLYGAEILVKDEDKSYKCTEDGWVASENGNDTEEIKPSEEDTEVIELKKVDSILVVGVAEKGPFAKGGVVVLTGLDSSLAKTKKTFKGSVDNDKGNFEIKNVSLETQYAVIEVNGPFFSEKDGKKTTGKAKLNALVDLSAGDTVKVNVNVLTELEYARTMELVTSLGYNVPAAKKRATMELAAAFGVKISDVSATSISLADTGKTGLALYSASIALLGNLPATSFQARLKKVSESFASKGSLGDTLLVELADELSTLDSAGTFAQIKANLISMRVSEKIPEFDFALNRFWSKIYKLDDCTEALEKEEKIENVSLSLSENDGAGYVCSAGRWHKITELDGKFGFCKADIQGNVKEYKGDSYICANGTWRIATDVESELSLCLEDGKKGVTKDKKYYQCISGVWANIDAIEYELGFCNAETENSVKKLASGKSYVCEKGADSWREATEYEVLLGELCLVKNDTAATAGKKYFMCLDNWTPIEFLEYELGLCQGDNALKVAKASDGNYYACEAENDKWRKATEGEIKNSKICTENLDQTVENGFACDKLNENKDFAWRSLTEIEKEIGYCDASKKGSVEWLGKTWGEPTEDDKIFFENFLPGTDVSETPNVKRDDNGKSQNGTFYVCDGNSWSESSGVAYAYGTSCKNGELRSYRDESSLKLFIKQEKWPVNTTYKNQLTQFGMDYEALQIMGYDNYVASIVVEGKDTLRYAMCQDNGWVKVSELDYNLQFACSILKSEKIVNDYVCAGEDGDFIWTQCVDANENKVNDAGYACVKSGSSYMWRKADDGEVIAKTTCRQENNGKFVYDEGDNPYRCIVKSDGSANWGAYTFKTFTDDRDGNVYKTVDVGNQVWMAEYLKYEGTKDAPLGAICSNKEYCEVGTNLHSYKWHEAMDLSESLCGVKHYCNNVHVGATGICPNGFHIPTLEEVKIMEDYIKSKKWEDVRNYGMNDFGEKAYWISDEYSEFNAYRYFGYQYQKDGKSVYGINYLQDSKNLYYWIRCIQDD